MSLGFAVASLKGNVPAVAIFADTQISFESGVRSSFATKTYDVGDRYALVAAGAALPPITTIEIVRRFIGNHNLKTPDRRLGFYDVARMTAYYLAQARMRASAEPCEAVLAGFSSSGAPALAYMRATPHDDVLSFFRPLAEGVVVVPVGVPKGAALIVEALKKSIESHHQLVAAGVGMLWHLINSDHRDFVSIGGGVSGATCEPAAVGFSWPAIRIADRIFLHGLDLTDEYLPSWPPPIEITYDEEWYAEIVRRVSNAPGTSTELGPKFVASFANDGSRAANGTPEKPLEASVDRTNLFKTHDDPAFLL